MLGGLGVVPRQKADQRLDGGAGGRLPQVVLQQLLHQVEAMQVRPGRLPRGQGPQQGQAVLHAGRGAAVARPAPAPHPQAAHSTAQLPLHLGRGQGGALHHAPAAEQRLVVLDEL